MMFSSFRLHSAVEIHGSNGRIRRIGRSFLRLSFPDTDFEFSLVGAYVGARSSRPMGFRGFKKHGSPSTRVLRWLATPAKLWKMVN